MLFDGHVTAADIAVLEAEDHVELAITVAVLLPAGNTVMPMPIGIARFPLSRDAAIKYGTKLKEAGENLPEQKKSDLVIAQDLSGVDAAVKQQEQFKGRK